MLGDACPPIPHLLRALAGITPEPQFAIIAYQRGWFGMEVEQGAQLVQLLQHPRSGRNRCSICGERLRAFVHQRPSDGSKRRQLKPKSERHGQCWMEELKKLWSDHPEGRADPRDRTAQTLQPLESGLVGREVTEEEMDHVWTMDMALVGRGTWRNGHCGPSAQNPSPSS